jgi:hypothetical protein
MAGIKKLTSYFKQLTKDEIEVEELLATQLSKNSKDRIKLINENKNFPMKKTDEQMNNSSLMGFGTFKVDNSEVIVIWNWQGEKKVGSIF